jgi:hypothetical protein
MPPEPEICAQAMAYLTALTEIHIRSSPKLPPVTSASCADLPTGPFPMKREVTVMLARLNRDGTISWPGLGHRAAAVQYLSGTIQPAAPRRCLR